jgi:hypothetical protein
LRESAGVSLAGLNLLLTFAVRAEAKATPAAWKAAFRKPLARKRSSWNAGILPAGFDFAIRVQRQRQLRRRDSPRRAGGRGTKGEVNPAFGLDTVAV